MPSIFDRVSYRHAAAAKIHYKSSAEPFDSSGIVSIIKHHKVNDVLAGLCSVATHQLSSCLRNAPPWSSSPIVMFNIGPVPHPAVSNHGKMIRRGAILLRHAPQQLCAWSHCIDYYLLAAGLSWSRCRRRTIQEIRHGNSFRAALT